MDITPFLELKIAPAAVFDSLAERRTRPRFMVPADSRDPGAGDWTAVTWGAFAEQIQAISCFLGSIGLSSKDRVAVFGHNRVEWLSAALGAQAAGCVMVPIYPASTADQAAYIAEHSDSKALFVGGAELLERVLERWPAYAAVQQTVLLDGDGDVAAALQNIRARGKTAPSIGDVAARIVSWSQAIAIGQARHAQEPGAFEARMRAVDLDQPGLMLYTSGTTGEPKGVPLSHRNVGVNGRDWLTLNGSALEEQGVDLLWLPFSHIFGFGEACLGNTLGFVSYLSDPQAVLAHLPQVKPSVLMSVPAYWDKLAKLALTAADRDARRAKLAELTGGRLRFCLSGGAGLSRETKELFYDCGTLIIEGYGLTECSPTLTLNRAGAFRFDSVGKPLPSVELKLADDGEILARGASVFSGYHKNDAATREAFTPDGWLKTGDIGRFTADGFLQIIDRKKEILVTAGGKNVPPVNIELRLAGDPLIAHAIVYGDGKSYLVAGIWLSAEAVDEKLAALGVPDCEREAAIAGLVRQRVDSVNLGLARFEQIKKHRIMAEPLTVARGLLTGTLKIRRKAIYCAFRDQFESMYE